MIVRVITVYVKEEYIEEFKTATIKNRNGSIREPGILRFDVLQDTRNPGVFLLIEVYASEEATEAHKETPHYREWKEKVEPMMAKPREGKAFIPIAPTDISEWE